MNVNEPFQRLNHILDSKGISTKDLYLRTERHPNTIYHYRKGVRKPDFEFLQQLKEIIPELNLNWLVIGEGEPFLNESNGNTTDEKMEVKTVESKTEAKSEVISEMEKIKAGMIDAFKKQLDDVAQAAMVGLEKLRVAASATLLFCMQVVRNQNLQSCK